MPDNPVEMFAETVVRLGFADTGDYYRLVRSVDISTTEARDSFRHWQHSDGTKAGLLRSFPSLAHRAVSDRPKT